MHITLRSREGADTGEDSAVTIHICLSSVCSETLSTEGAHEHLVTELCPADKLEKGRNVETERAIGKGQKDNGSLDMPEGNQRRDNKGAAH